MSQTLWSGPGMSERDERMGSGAEKNPVYNEDSPSYSPAQG